MKEKKIAKCVRLTEKTAEFVREQAFEKRISQSEFIENCIKKEMEEK